MSRLLIFTIATLALGQAPLWAQHATQPNIVELAAPIEIHVAEDVESYMEDVEYPAMTQQVLARSVERLQQPMDETSLFELTSENWFANYDVALGSDTLTPSLQSSPQQAPEYDFLLNNPESIASWPTQSMENEFADLASDRRDETRSVVVPRQTRRKFGEQQFAAQTEQASPSDQYSNQQYTTKPAVITRPAIVQQQTSRPAPAFDPKAAKRKLVVAKAQQLMPRRAEPQRTSGLTWLMLPLIAGPLTWFGIQYYREQKATQQRAVGCDGCETTHLQCDECPEQREANEQRQQAECDASESMHYQRRSVTGSEASLEANEFNSQNSDTQERRASQTSSRIAERAAEPSGLIPKRKDERFEAERQAGRQDAQDFDRDQQTSQDDLTRIYGIGPATSKVLRQEGVVSFSDVASTDALTLESILAAAGSRFQLINPTTWPTQAEYAVSGDWEGLEAWRAAELESMENESGDFEFAAEEFVQADCDQELAVLEDANTLLASVSRIRRESDSIDEVDFEELEESGYEEARFDEFDFEDRGYQEEFDSESRDDEWSPVEAKEDDLTEIRGIGVATRELLRDHGIQGFTDLIDADVDSIQAILDQAGSRFQTANPEAWMQEARGRMKVSR